MSVDTTLAVLYAQSGLSTNAATMAFAPQASLAMSRVLAAEQARQERQQVEKSDKSEKANINADDGGGRNSAAFRRRRMAMSGQLPDQEPKEAPSPWVGNLLNVKI